MKDWTEALVTSGNRVDFLSWHSYMSDPNRYSQDQRNLISWLMPYPGYTLLPKLITEYGFSGSKHPRYGTSFAAAHTAAVVRQLITGGPSYLFSFQLKDGPGQQTGDGWGLLTHEDNGANAKPRYHVFSFLDSMKGNRIDLRGEGSWVTGFASLNGGTVRVLLVNYDENEQHAENVPVMFTNLDPGTYTYRERFFRGRDVSFTESVSGSILSKELYMPSLSVVILELTKR
jgi:hypothetical protein